MDESRLKTLSHDHVFLGADHDRNERRTWIVVGVTAAMMVGEIVGGSIYGSMALVADGWHMSTHAAALTIAALAYRYARRHASNPRFTFGTGKIGELAGFASAVALAIVALLIGWESLVRLFNPRPISFDQATMIAVLGLVVNLASAWLLHQGAGGHGHSHSHGGHEDEHEDVDHDHDHDHGHDHGHDHDHAAHAHDHDHGHGHDHAGHDHDHDHAHAAREEVLHDAHDGHDHNLRAAYMHVIADALTSVMAILGLLAGRFLGWWWMDPIMGVVGALVISHWAWGLMKSAGAVLVDGAGDERMAAAVRRRIEGDGVRVTDLHLWRVGPGHRALIVSVAAARPAAPEAYKARLAGLKGLSHVTVEVNPSV